MFIKFALAMFLSTGAQADNGWNVRCEIDQPAVYVRLNVDFMQNYACTEGTGNFAHQYLPTFKRDSTLFIGSSTYSIKEGSSLIPKYFYSCDAVNLEMAADRPELLFLATDTLTGVQVRVERQHGANALDIYKIVNGNSTEACHGQSAR